MTVLFFLPAALLFVVILAVGQRNRDYLFEIARSLQNQKAFAPENALSPRDAIRPTPDSNREQLDGAALHEVLEELSAYVRLIKPDWIAGVHPGGRLLSVYVADQIDFPKNRCLFVRTSPDRTDSIEFEPKSDIPNEPLQGKIVIIDDISRTGDTLSSLKWFLMRKNYIEGYQLTEVYFAVLLVVSEEGASRSRFRPDWVYFRTDKKFFRLPWSELSIETAAAYAHRRQGLSYSQAVIDRHEKIVSDPDYALHLAKSYISKACAAAA